MPQHSIDPCIRRCPDMMPTRPHPCKHTPCLRTPMEGHVPAMQTYYTTCLYINVCRILNRRRRSSIYVMRVYPNPLRRQLAATSLCESTHCHVFAGGVDRERRVPACMQGSTDCDWGAPWPMAHEVSGLQISLDHLPRTSKFTSLNSMPCFIVEFFTS
jgi:hypothetical protein